MKSKKFKFLILLMLLIMTLASLQIISATKVVITWEGSGRVTTIVYPNGSSKSTCDGSPGSKCTYKHTVFLD